MSIDAWKKVFLSGAFFNWIFAVAMTATPHLTFDLLGLGPVPANPIWLALFVWLVIVFGYGYFLVSQDPPAHRDLVLLGALGKIGVFIAVAGYWYAGLASTILLIVAGGDLIYAVLFFRFLRTGPKAP